MDVLMERTDNAERSVNLAILQGSGIIGGMDGKDDGSTQRQG
jgi:hypothetical protein